MSGGYSRVRTVSPARIATEMGWSKSRTKAALWNLRWLTLRYRVGPKRYNADVIEALRKLYRQNSDDKDFLSRYLKNKEIT